MKRGRKLTFWLGGLGLGLLLALALLDRSGYLVRALKSQAAQGLERALNRSVELDSVDGGVFGSVVLRGLKIGPSAEPGLLGRASLEVEKASLIFSLWDYLILRKEAALCLRRLELEAPVFRLGPAAPAPAGPAGSALPLKDLPLPPLATRIHSGLILSHDGRPLLESLHASLSANRRKNQAEFNLGFKVLGGDARLKGHWSPELGLGRADMELGGLRFKSLSPTAFDQGSLQARVLVELKPAPGAHWSKGIQIKGLAKIEDLRLQGGRGLERLDAEIEFKGRGAATRRLEALAFGGKVEGRAELADLSDTELELKLWTTDSALRLMGGRAKRVELEAGLSLQALKLRRLQAFSEEAPCLEASGFLPFNGSAPAFTAVLEHYPIGSGLEPARLNGRLDLGGSAGRVTATAALSCPLWRILDGGAALEGLSAQIRYDSGSWRATAGGAWGALKPLKLEAVGRLRAGSWEADSIVLKRGEETWIKAALRAGAGGSGALRGSAELSLPLTGELLAALDSSSGIQGPLMAQAVLAGDKAAPRLSLSMDGSRLSAGGRPFPLQARLELASGRWKLERLKARGREFQAKGDLSPPGRLEAAFRDADAAAFFSALEAGGPGASGRLDGSLSLKLEPGDWTLEASLRSLGLALAGFNSETAQIEGALGPGRWELKKLAADQAGGGSLAGKGLFDPKGQGEANLSLQAKDWKFAGQTYGFNLGAQGARPGKVSAWFSRDSQPQSGRREVSGDFAAQELVVDSKPLPDLKGHWTWFEKGELSLKNFSFGRGLSASALWRKGHAWEFSAEARDYDAKALLALVGLGTGALKGGVSAEISARGQGLNGSLELRMDRARADLAWDSSSTRGRAEARGMELARALELASIGGSGLLAEAARKWSGRLTATAELDSTRAMPLSFTAQATELRQGGRSWVAASARGEAGRDSVALKRLEFGPPNSRLVLQDFGLKRERPGVPGFSGSFEALNFPEGGFFKATGKGVIRAGLGPEGGEGEAHWEELRLNRHSFGPGAAMARQEKEHWVLKDLGVEPAWEAAFSWPAGGMLDLESLKAATKGGAALEAVKGLDEEGKARLELSARGVDFGVIAGILDWPLALGGAVWGNGVLRLPRKAQEHTRLMLSAKVENGHISGFPFDLATGSVRMEQGRLDLKPMGEPVRVGRKDRFDAEVSGLIPVEEGLNEEMALVGRFTGANLGLLDYLEAIDSASGTLTAEVRIKGTPKYPEFNGKAEISGGGIRFDKLIAPASDLQARIFIDSNRLQILRMDMQVGDKGQRAYIDAGPGDDAAITFDQWIPSKFNLKISTGKAGIPLQASPRYNFISADAQVELLLGGSWEDPSLEGRLGLLGGNVVWPIKKGRELPPRPGDFSGRMLWDLNARALGKVNFLGGDALRAEVVTTDKGLRIFGPGDDLMVEGKIKAVRGRVQFLTADFSLNEGEESTIEFRRDQPPVISLWGLKDRPGGLGAIKIHAFGPVGKINLDFPDDPDVAHDEEARRRKAALIGLGSDDPDLGSVLSKGLVWLVGSRVFPRVRQVDVNVRAPGLANLGRSQTDPGYLSSTTNVSVDVGTYVRPGVYVGGGYENKIGSTETRAKVEMPVLNKQWTFSGEAKQDSISGSSVQAVISKRQSMGSYDPKKSRQEQERRKLARTAKPTATPSPTPPAEPRIPEN